MILIFCFAFFVALGSGAASAAGPPTTLEDVVVLAKGAVSLGVRSELTTGQVVVNDPGGVATVKPFVHGLTGTQLIADTVQVTKTLARARPELFDVFANTLTPGAGLIIDGTGPTPVTLPLFTFPDPPVVMPGTDPCPIRRGKVPGNCIIRQSDGPVTLMAGNYRDILVLGHASLNFAGGTYNVRQIRGGGFSTIFFNGPTTLNVQQRVLLGGASVVGPSDPSVLNGRCVTVNIGGDMVRLAFVTANVVAPNAAVTLLPLTVYEGTLVGRTVRVGVGTVLIAAPTAPACP